MVDFVSLQLTAARLIKENGRSVTFIRHNQTDAVSAEPWNGPTDPRATPDITSVQDAVFVEPGSLSKLGLSSETSDLVMNSEKIMMVSPGSVDLSTFQEVLDGAVYWKINKVETLQPGSTAVLSFVGVSR